MNEHKTRVNPAEAMKECLKKQAQICRLLQKVDENSKSEAWLNQRYCVMLKLFFHWKRRAEAMA